MLITGGLFFTACPNNSSTVAPSATATNSTASTTTPEIAPDKPGYVAKAKAADDSRISRILLQNYWVIVKYYHPNAKKMALGKGRWFKFEKDGTFISGRWAATTANGVWRLSQREGKDFILLDSSIDSEDSEFEIQKIRGSEDAMAWVGSDRYPEYDPAAFQIDNLLTIPTKQQFGEE